MKRSLIALALVAAAGGAFADQSTTAVVTGSIFQAQGGTVNVQTMDLAGINAANANVATRAVVSNVGQLQFGTRNTQVAQVGSVLPSAPVGLLPLRTNVTVTGTVAQIQGGADNLQRARIGVIY